MKPVLLVLVFFATQSFAQTNQFAKVVTYYNAERNFNGAALVATNGQIDFITGTGIANRQSGTTINSKSKFKIASITKTFTAVIIMQLKEEGKLLLTDVISKYLPAYKGEAKDKVSLYQLLTYSSGIPNCETGRDMLVYQVPVSIDSFIDKYSSGRLESVPGTKFNYDNGDYVILGRIIEKITGKSFTQNVHERILDKSGMQNTDMLTSGDIVTGLVSAYTYNDSAKSFSSEVPYFIENFFSAAAMYSTVEDLLKFDQGIFTYKLLKKTSVDEMIRPDEKLGNVGLGFWYTKGYGKINVPYVYRPGGILGSAANWIHILDSNRAIIAFANTDATNLFEMSQQLYAVSTGKPADSSFLVKQLAPAKDLANVKGTWILDLRPGPNSQPYLKEFVITPTTGKNFSGEFYGTPFTTGLFNTDWDKLFFAFTTGDKTNTYFHSGYIDGDTIFGISFSPDRKFTSHWTGKKK